MSAKYDIDDKVTINGKIIEAVTNDTGTTYQVKITANNKSTIMWFEEDELNAEVAQQAKPTEDNTQTPSQETPVEETTEP